MDDLEALTEEPQELVLPLDCQRSWDEDEAALDGLPKLHLLDEKPGHDRFTGAGIVS